MNTKIKIKYASEWNEWRIEVWDGDRIGVGATIILIIGMLTTLRK